MSEEEGNEEDDDCPRCHQSMHLSDEFERPDHGLCWLCSTTVLDEVLPELEELRAFKKEWDTKDGNSPGYNLDKARNYGSQAAKYKRLFEAFKLAAEAASMLRVAMVEAGPRYDKARELIEAARSLEVELLGEWNPPKEMSDKDWFIASARYRGPVWGKSLVEELTTEQLREEVDRREGIGPYEDLHVSVLVTGRRPSGHRTTILQWECNEVEADSFSASHNKDFCNFKAARAE